MLQDEFCFVADTAREWNQGNAVKMDIPEFPTLQEVLKQAEVINNFVSDTK